MNKLLRLKKPKCVRPLGEETYSALLANCMSWEKLEIQESSWLILKKS